MCEISVEGQISVIFETKRNDNQNDIKFYIVSVIGAETILDFISFRLLAPKQYKVLYSQKFRSFR